MNASPSSTPYCTRNNLADHCRLPYQHLVFHDRLARKSLSMRRAGARRRAHGLHLPGTDGGVGGKTAPGTCEEIDFTDAGTTDYQYFTLWIIGPNSISSHVPGTVSFHNKNAVGPSCAFWGFLCGLARPRGSYPSSGPRRLGRTPSRPTFSPGRRKNISHTPMSVATKGSGTTSANEPTWP